MPRASYQAWTNLESATRDAAQYLATSDTDPTSPDYTTQGTNSDNKAIFILSEATGFTFTPVRDSRARSRTAASRS